MADVGDVSRQVVPANRGRWQAARPRLAWAGAVVGGTLVLFWCYLRLSQSNAVNSDGAGVVLQGWDMVHGNVLLSGWQPADVTFATFEAPVDGLVAAVHGLNPDAVHITAAIVYTLVVLTAALLAKGTARGVEGVVRAVLAAGILVTPGISPGIHILALAGLLAGLACLVRDADRVNAYAFPEAAVRRVFGKPEHEYRVNQYIIMVWDKNLLLTVHSSSPAR